KQKRAEKEERKEVSMSDEMIGKLPQFDGTNFANIMLSALSVDEYNKVIGMEIAKDIWDTLHDPHEGGPQEIGLGRQDINDHKRFDMFTPSDYHKGLKKEGYKKKYVALDENIILYDSGSKMNSANIYSNNYFLQLDQPHLFNINSHADVNIIDEQLLQGTAIKNDWFLDYLGT
ncbi:hypothetical protein ACJX0J_016036, partial [Zea mays]